ncbi:MAG: translocation/assembly module TamB domain-containing protein, partial [Bacteroidota bacterium]
GYYDFDAKFSSQTELGDLAADLHLTLSPLVPVSTYRGSLVTKNFNVDGLGLSAQTLSRKLNLNANLAGQGFSLSDAQVKLSGLVTQSDLVDVAIDTLRTNVDLAEREVRGLVYLFDGTGRADLDLNINLRESPQLYQATGSLEQIDLNRYRLLSDTLIVTTQLEADLNGDSLEAMVGSLILKETQLARPDSSRLIVPSFELISTFTGLEDSLARREKVLQIDSDLLKVDIHGKFTFDRVFDLTKQLQTEVKLFTANKDSSLEAYYAQKQLQESDLDISLAISPGDSLNAALGFFQLPLYLEPNYFPDDPSQAIIQAKLRYVFQGENSLEELTIRLTQLDTLFAYGIGARAPEMDVNLVKLANQNTLLVSGGVYTGTFTPDPAFSMDELRLDLAGDSRTFELDLLTRQAASNSLARLGLMTRFLPDGRILSSIQPDESLIAIQRDTLNFIQAGEVTFQGDSVLVNPIKLESKDHSRAVSAEGILSPYNYDSLMVRVDSFNLRTINELINVGYELGGVYNAKAALRAVLGELKVSLSSRLDDFTLDDYHYGDLDIQSRYQPTKDAVKVNAQLIDQGDTTILITGQYRIKDEENPLAFNLLTQEGFPLGYITPFVEGELYGIEGRVELQEFVVKGTPSSPVVNGIGFFQQAGFGVSYFKTQYTLGGRILFDNDRIVLEDLKLFDRYQSIARRANLHGNILHRNMRQFRFDLQVDSVQNFLLMDTRKQDNDLFYGTLFVNDALADITGDLSQLSLNAIASFGPKSILRLPLTDFSTYGRPEYIIFTDEVAEETGPANTGLLGYDINLTALLTENLEVELIFDERVGDIIRGRGEGSLNMQVDESGAFSMFGRYEVTQGDYLFTSQNVINKKFEV